MKEYKLVYFIGFHVLNTIFTKKHESNRANIYKRGKYMEMLYRFMHFMTLEVCTRKQKGRKAFVKCKKEKKTSTFCMNRTFFFFFRNRAQRLNTQNQRLADLYCTNTKHTKKKKRK